MLVDAKNVAQKLCWKSPIKIINSPTKLLVKGKLILAIEKIKNTIANNG
jgi:hypothetical protein